jgi:hypothetical protein
METFITNLHERRKKRIERRKEAPNCSTCGNRKEKKKKRSLTH